jgi:DMSO/TMAO reductase YedYZ molybdopterin-dependent catalytic subunit
MTTLSIGGACVARELELGLDELRALPAHHQVPDVGLLVEGRKGAAVRLSALAELANPTAEARLVHVASLDGGFSANLPIEQALSGGLLLYSLDDAELPARYGGPFRLLFVDSEDCSVSVKFLGRIEFVAQPGSHTARCSD